MIRICNVRINSSPGNTLNMDFVVKNRQYVVNDITNGCQRCFAF